MAGAYHSSHLAGAMRSDAFLPYGFGDPADRRRRVLSAAERRIAPELLELLRAQNGAARLPEPGSVLVVTGQQVGLFLGPLYTLYKAAGAVAIARALERETGVRATPLFWLQTEDHDFAEIASCRVAGEPGCTLSLDEDPLHARESIAQRRLGPDVTRALDGLDDALDRLPHAAEVSALLRAHYREGAPIAGAFAGVLQRLFAGEGLLVFDPRHPVAARLAAPILRRSIVEYERLESLLKARGQALRAAGFDEQIRVRAGSPLVFFHAGSARGPRHRLIRQGDGFTLSGRDEQVSGDQLLALVDQEPLRFSTSALLRPIVQDTLLPTAVYVGGPAELDYFAQATALYPAFDLVPPLVAHRPRFRLLPPPVRRLLDELELVPAELDRPRDALERQLAARGGVDQHAPAPSWAAELEQRLSLLEQRALEPSLRRAITRTRATVRRALERLERRHHRLTVERERTLHDRLTRLQHWLRPDGAPQERVYAFAAFAARAGVDALVRTIVDAVDPFDPAIRDLDT